MTKQELNRDIKRLYNKIESLRSGNNDTFFKFIEGEGKNEFTRLYYADQTTEYLTKDSLVKMMILNKQHHYINPAFFYINAEV